MFRTLPKTYLCAWNFPTRIRPPAGNGSYGCIRSRESYAQVALSLVSGGHVQVGQKLHGAVSPQPKNEVPHNSFFRSSSPRYRKVCLLSASFLTVLGS